MESDFGALTVLDLDFEELISGVSEPREASCSLEERSLKRSQGVGRVSGVSWLTLVAKFVVDCDCRCVAFSVELTWELGA